MNNTHVHEPEPERYTITTHTHTRWRIYLEVARKNRLLTGQGDMCEKNTYIHIQLGGEWNNMVLLIHFMYKQIRENGLLRFLLTVIPFQKVPKVFVNTCATNKCTLTFTL